MPALSWFMSGSQSPRPAAAPHKGVDTQHGDDEEDDFDDGKQSGVVQNETGPRVEEHDFDIENDEEHRRQVVLDGEVAAADGLRRWIDTAFVGIALGAVVPQGQRSSRG